MKTPTTPAKDAILDVEPRPSNQMMAGNKGFGITTEKFDEGVAGYGEEAQDVLRFWFDLAKDKGWSISALAKTTGVSTTTLSRVFSGKYGAELDSLLETLNRAQGRLTEAVDNPDFIMTSLARHMFTAFDKCRLLKNVTLMYGKMGIGKTTIEKEYTRLNNHGKTFYVRCPGHGVTVHQFVAHVAKSMRIALAGSSMMKMRIQITKYLARGGRLLIIDELHQIFLTCPTLTIVRICEWLRELQDEANCGLVLTGTELLEKEFFRGVHKSVLAQLVDRGTVQIPLDSKPTKKDILAFLAHYGLRFPSVEEVEGSSLLNDIIASNGLRKLTLHLRDGASYAARKEEPYSWRHFVEAHDAIQSLGGRR